MVQLVIPIIGLLASTFLLIAGNGLAGVLIPIRASIEGWSPVLIGWIGFGFALSFTVGCFIIPRMVLRVGHVRVYGVLAAILAMSVLMHGLIVHPIAWIIFRGFGGFALAGTYMIVESWLNEKTSNEARGQTFSIYMVCSMVGLMAGQLLLTASDPATTTLFMISAMLLVGALIPTALSNASSPKPLNEVSLDLRKLFANSPLAFVGVALTGFAFGAFSFQMPVYLQISGFTEAQIASTMAIAMIGGMVFQFPLGRISDRMDRRYVIIAATMIGVVLAVIMAATAGLSPAGLLVLVFLFGGVLVPLYSLVTAYANDHADPDEFVEVSSGLLILYGIGSMAGPVAAGVIMNIAGPGGLFVAIAISYVSFALYAAWRVTQRPAVPQEDMTDFTYAPPSAPAQTQESLYLDPRSDD